MKKTLLAMSLVTFTGLFGASTLSLAADSMPGASATDTTTPAAAPSDQAGTAAAPTKVVHKTGMKRHHHAAAKKTAAKTAKPAAGTEDSSNAPASTSTK